MPRSMASTPSEEKRFQKLSLAATMYNAASVSCREDEKEIDIKVQTVRVSLREEMLGQYTSRSLKGDWGSVLQSFALYLGLYASGRRRSGYSRFYTPLFGRYEQLLMYASLLIGPLHRGCHSGSVGHLVIPGYPLVVQYRISVSLFLVFPSLNWPGGY